MNFFTLPGLPSDLLSSQLPGVRAMKSTLYGPGGEVGAEVDRVAGLLVTLPGEHSRIHDGYAYKVNFEIGALAQGASVEYSFRTPAEIQIHLQNIVIAAENADVAVEVRRGTIQNPLTIENPGAGHASIIGPHNLNDVLNYPAQTLILHSPTYVAGATGEVWDRLFLPGAGTNQYRSVGVSSDSPNEEYVMRQETFYVIRVRNVDATNAASGVNVRMFWYGRAPI